MKDAAPREQANTETDATGHGLRVPFSGDESAGTSVGGGPRRPASRGRIAKLIAAKLALDLLFVAAFALYTHAVTFSRRFDGALEHADGRGARGWVEDLERPGEPVEVQLFENGRFVASVVADEPRPDDGRAGAPSGAGARRGFSFKFVRPLYGEHELRVYGVRAGRGGARRTIQQFGEPLHSAWK
ncbi:MAG: hypothetical protein LC795_03980 [Acidobacteria bacterium]|nr:hypothetical protein [Acidobacteriota bacterium]